MHAICVIVKGKLLHAVTQGDQGFIKRCNSVEFLQYDKITVKMPWLYFAKTFESLCDTPKIVISSAV